MNDKQPCVYLLASQPRGTIYIGVTSSLEQRIAQHRQKAMQGFTSKYNILRLVRYEMYDDMEAAIIREKRLKNWHRQWKINLIKSENPTWNDLAIGMGFDPLPPYVSMANIRKDGC